MKHTVAGLLAGASAVLREAGIDSPERDARALLACALRLPAGRLTLHLRDPVGSAEAEHFGLLLAERLSRRPVSRILGRRVFFGRDFRISRAVLDPRPETETLVALALAGRFARVLDLGTGSGCILVSLLAERATAIGTGTDISADALTVASANARSAGVVARTMFVQSDWWANVRGRFDLIVSNPPYIAAAELDGLAPEVRQHDPEIALSDFGDGLGAYRAIAAGAATHLAPRGRLLVEIGPTQADNVIELFAAVELVDPQVHRDLDGRDRVVAAFLR